MIFFRFFLFCLFFVYTFFSLSCYDADSRVVFPPSLLLSVFHLLFFFSHFLLTPFFLSLYDCCTTSCLFFSFYHRKSLFLKFLCVLARYCCHLAPSLPSHLLLFRFFPFFLLSAGLSGKEGAACSALVVPSFTSLSSHVHGAEILQWSTVVNP